MIQNLLRQLAHLFLRRHFFQHRVLEQLLLNEIGQLERVICNISMR